MWPEVNPSNKTLLDDFVVYLKSKKRKNTTLIQYIYDLKLVFCYIYKYKNNISILKMTKKDFRELILFMLEERQSSNARVNRLLSVCKSLLTFAQNEEEYDYQVNQIVGMGSLEKEPVRKIIFLEDEIIKKLVDKFIDEKRYMEATLCSLLYESGARKSEIVQVEKYSFYNEEKNYTNKVVGKRGKVYRPIYHDLTKKCAKLYLDRRGEDDIDALFINRKGEPASPEQIYEWVKRWRRDLRDITGQEIEINVHTFRHSMIENNLRGNTDICKKLKIKDGMPVEIIKILVNHNTTDMTFSYAKDRNEELISRFFGYDIED